MDKSAILKSFNNYFFEFLEEAHKMLPANEEITIAQTSFELIRKANPTSIAKAWYLYVYKPYEQVFAEGNISFFFDKDYSSDLQYVANSSNIIEMIDKIRVPLKNLGPEQIAYSSKYIQALCKLSILYYTLTDKSK
jgi:hypothetical protein